MRKNKLAVALPLCLAVCVWNSPAQAETVYTVTADGATNSLDGSHTLGSIELKLKPRGQLNAIKLVCGISGQAVGGSFPVFNFQHTVVCEDHSLLVLNTTTTLTVQSSCTAPAGTIVGTFQEVSSVVGLAGPFAGATGTLKTDGTINCAFNNFTSAGTLTRP
jgi:hypothetical protein